MSNHSVLILGAGELASAAAVRLHRCGIAVSLTEIAAPLAVRRRASFSDAALDGSAVVEGITAKRAGEGGDAREILAAGKIPLFVVHGDPIVPPSYPGRPDVLVDGRILKGGHRLRLTSAPLVIGLGPGFHPGNDCHCAVETNRGPRLGAVLTDHPPENDTGVPGVIAGEGAARVLRAGAPGIFVTEREIGETIRAGEEAGSVGGAPVKAAIDGILRGLIRPGTAVTERLKVVDIDPRREVDVTALSDKALAVAGGVLEALLRFGGER